MKGRNSMKRIQKMKSRKRIKRVFKGGSIFAKKPHPLQIDYNQTRSYKLSKLAITLKKLSQCSCGNDITEADQKVVADLSKKIMDASASADETSVTTSAKTLSDNLKPTNTEGNDPNAMNLINLLFKSKTQNEAIISKFGGKKMTIQSIDASLVEFTSVHTINSKKTKIYDYKTFESDAQSTFKMSTLDIMKLISLLHYKDLLKTSAYDKIGQEGIDIGIFGYLTLSDPTIDLIVTKSKDQTSELLPSKYGENRAYPEAAKRKKLPLIGIMFDIFKGIYNEENIKKFIEWANNIHYSSYSTFFNGSSEPPNDEANYKLYLKKINLIMNKDTFKTVLSNMNTKVPEAPAPALGPVAQTPSRTMLTETKVSPLSSNQASQVINAPASEIVDTGGVASEILTNEDQPNRVALSQSPIEDPQSPREGPPGRSDITPIKPAPGQKKEPRSPKPPSGKGFSSVRPPPAPNTSKQSNKLLRAIQPVKSN